MPIVADAAAAIRADMSGFERDLKQGGDRATKTLGQQLKSVFSPRNLAIAGVAGGVAIAGAITAGLAGAIRDLIDIERLNAQTDAAIKSTGGTANVTRDAIESMSEAAERVTTIKREDVQEVANLLLTFRDIRNEAGAGNDIFNRATEAVLDLSTAMGTDTRSAAMQLGKALNDPIGGVTALRRAGVQLTDQQKEQVTAFVESGNILSAQRVILEELERQTGGSAAAFADTTAGKIQRFQNDVGNMFESIVLGAAKVSDALADDPLEGFAMNFGEQGDRVHAIADRFGQNFDDLKTRIETRMDETGESFTEATDHIEREMEGARLATSESSWEMMQGILSSVHEGGEQIKREFTRQAEEGVSIMSAAAQDFRDAAFQNQVSYAKGLLDGQNQPRVQMEALKQIQEESMSRTAEIAYLMGQLTSKQLAAGLSSDRDTVRAQAEATRMSIVNRLSTLGVSAFNWGYGIAHELALGMAVGRGEVIQGAAQLGGAVRSQIGVESEPAGHDSPLRGITRWGGNIVKTIADGIYGELSTGANAASALASSLIPGMPAAAMAGAAIGGGSGNTYQWILNAGGVERVFTSRDDFMAALDDLGAFNEGRL